MQGAEQEGMIVPEEFIVWDLETTGFDPLTCEITEIGAMRVIKGEVVEKKSWLLNHGIEIPEVITQLTGITKAMLDADGRDPKECLHEFIEFLIPTGETIKVMPNLTHNGIKFDIPFLMGCEKRLDAVFMTDEERNVFRSSLEEMAIDTAVMVKAQKLGLQQADGETFYRFANRVMDIRAYGVKYNVTLCVEEFGIPKDGMTMHRAMADVHFTNEIFKKLTA